MAEESGEHGKTNHKSAGAKTAGAAKGAKDSLGRARQAAKSVVGRQVDAALTAGGKRAGKTAETVREIGDRLRDGDDTFAADLANVLAGYVDRVAGYLRDTDSDTLAADAERYGRRYPVAFAGAAFTAGFALSRFVKVSSARRLQAGHE